MLSNSAYAEALFGIQLWHIDTQYLFKVLPYQNIMVIYSWVVGEGHPLSCMIYNADLHYNFLEASLRCKHPGHDLNSAHACICDVSHLTLRITSLFGFNKELIHNHRSTYPHHIHIARLL